MYIYLQYTKQYLHTSFYISVLLIPYYRISAILHKSKQNSHLSILTNKCMITFLSNKNNDKSSSLCWLTKSTVIKSRSGLFGLPVNKSCSLFQCLQFCTLYLHHLIMERYFVCSVFACLCTYSHIRTCIYAGEKCTVKIRLYF